MITHAIYNQLANESIRVELVYENSPMIAGSDELSALIRFRYIGKLPEESAVLNGADSNQDADTESEPQLKSEEQSGWSGLRRISSHFSNNARALFLQELESLPEEQDSLENDQTLLLGYVQVLSYLVTNPEILDDSQFEDLRKKSIIGGKLCGISGLEMGSEGSKPNGFLGGVANVFHTELGSEKNDSTSGSGLKNLKPFYSSSQSILFSDLTFRPSTYNTATASQEMVRSFYIGLKLPVDLPPSYESENLKIQHSLVLGYQLTENHKLSNKTMFFPLKVQAYVNKRAQQPVYKLTSSRLSKPVENEKIVFLNNNLEGLNNGFSFNSQQIQHHQPQISRKMSFRTIRRRLGMGDKRSRRTSSMTSLNSYTQRLSLEADYGETQEEVEEDQKQADMFAKYVTELNTKDVNEVVRVQDAFEAESNLNKEASNTLTPREELLSVFADLNSIKKESTESTELEVLIPTKPQSKFLLRVNGEYVYKVSFNKTVFKIGDIISINIQLNNDLSISGLETSLKQVETFPDEAYLLKNEYGDFNPAIAKNRKAETTLVSKSVSTFQTQEINQDIHIPHFITSQFSSDVVKVNYILEITCIFVADQKATENAENGAARRQFELVSVFNDSKGILYKPADYLSNGRELKCRIPVIILPNYEQDFGFVLNNH
ncbi:unnamed protein product [Kuraishia capsulata CBS 1993]|uniref:Rgp1-domain-containing protein n=1 Tax=Kuraishia capsulata CBS 1993 TaxID=1382522 RepID=W6MTX6_9ASCO|nr:uncharacterized protein KUCA_T00005963001 [Kuraishia capsulata CBS 1993]CDK29968.1 unnamed protein product [Kuraishia capsulata CBS 1993]